MGRRVKRVIILWRPILLCIDDDTSSLFISKDEGCTWNTLNTKVKHFKLKHPFIDGHVDTTDKLTFKGVINYKTIHNNKVFCDGLSKKWLLIKDDDLLTKVNKDNDNEPWVLLAKGTDWSVMPNSKGVLYFIWVNSNSIYPTFQSEKVGDNHE